MKNSLLLVLVALLLWSCGDGKLIQVDTGRHIFNHNWQFVKADEYQVEDSLFNKQNHLAWEEVSIPHTANIEPLIIGEQWQGDCLYRKFFNLSDDLKDKHIALYFEGAMQVADVYINDKLVTQHQGGYLPFYVDISNVVRFDSENCVLIRLNNEDNPQVPPGKPIDDLDFNYFSGIYRNVFLDIKNRVHISNEMDAGKVAGGGVFVNYPEVSKEKARVRVKVDIENELLQAETVKLELLLNKDGKLVSSAKVIDLVIDAKTSKETDVELNVLQPDLWSPHSPELYQLTVNLFANEELMDTRTEEIGIRSISFTAQEGFSINDEKLKLRGTNRHQEYPYIGYALSDNANYRDAYKIKKAGFNFVRLSHYPQSKAFLQACDQLGLLVMDAIPGWQFFGDSVFQENAINDVRNMVRRSRNHPCVVLWEASLNESAMTREFMESAHNAVHEEYPGNDTYTCGWLDEVYDVFIPARQHAKAPHYWNNYTKDKPLFIAEYGDWEYYAQNAGFNQKAFKNLSKEERTSRQLRGNGQKRLMQQALNYKESHNSNLQGPAVGDANWLMFDYNRGYAPDIESSGIMDIFRLPKFAHYFYQSQTVIGESKVKDMAEPMVFIANYYNDPSAMEVTIYSNCEEVELFINGESIGKQRADSDFNTSYLLNPPFTFKLKAFSPGELMAKGYINNLHVCDYSQKTPLAPHAIQLRIDESNKAFESNCNDVVFLYAEIVDKNGTIVPDASPLIHFHVEGAASLIGNPIHAEAGIATVLLKAGKQTGEILVKAESVGLQAAQLPVLIY